MEWCDGDIYRDIGNFDVEISVRVVSDMLECVTWEKNISFSQGYSNTMPSAIGGQKNNIYYFVNVIITLVLILGSFCADFTF